MKSFLLPLFLLSSIIACKSPSDNKLSIATASNMQYAMAALVDKFNDETGMNCDIILGSSGKLTAQIIEGAPYDLFVSADINFPKAVKEAGFARQAPKIYAYGKLVLWAMDEKNKPSIEQLSNNTIKHIALANPKTAPYGKAAMEVLNYYQLNPVIGTKLVYGESISQTNQFILSGSAEIGFTAKSVVLSPQLKNNGYWLDIDSGIYSPIEQAVVLLKGKKEKQDLALKFYEFLFSKEAKRILLEYGYDVP
ncbi:molybdate ABC transporter substrate-binding protein [Echinicola shivajiensis]|uniref:molybdate ABC transporter substrate-binding protein n=1 Tax=Echinicola shivajiensis TaxID=1035916 RepID=UPI001BFCCB80|nr:molybdate ABC transporter substrate-binding protein [Echinicola shivajiensis]